jgi:hypothetical protein
MRPNAIGHALALHHAMTNKNVKDRIDDAATTAKVAAEKAGHAVQGAAEKLAGATEQVADTVKAAGERAARKLGA